MSILVDRIPVTQDRLVKFQEMVRSARKMRGPQATQAWAAAQAGVSQSFVNDIENGPSPGVQLFNFWKYMRWLGFSMQEVGEVMGMEKTLDVEDADARARLTTILNAVERLSGPKRKMAEDVIEALVRGMQ